STGSTSDAKGRVICHFDGDVPPENSLEGASHCSVWLPETYVYAPMMFPLAPVVLLIGRPAPTYVIVIVVPVAAAVMVAEKAFIPATMFWIAKSSVSPVFNK